MLHLPNPKQHFLYNSSCFLVEMAVIEFSTPRLFTGFVFIQHPDLMFEHDVKNLYNNILRDKEASIGLKIQVLKNLQTYLQEEDCRMQQADKDCEYLFPSQSIFPLLLN